MITKQGLLASLQTALEYGYKGRERGESLLAVQCEADQMFTDLVNAADNCPDELMRIEIRHSGKLAQVDWENDETKKWKDHSLSNLRSDSAASVPAQRICPDDKSSGRRRRASILRNGTGRPEKQGGGGTR